MADQRPVAPPPIPTTGDMAYDGTELLKSMMMNGVKQMLCPTIVQASCGGYITIIDGIGVFASTTLQEAFDFAAVQAEQKMGAKATVDMSNLPRFMQPGAWERAKRKVGIAPIILLACGIAAVGIYTSGKGADNVTEWSKPLPRQSSEEPQVLQNSKGDEAARRSGSPSLPEVDVRKVPTEGYSERAQPRFQDDAPRRLRPRH